ncbi:MAG: hypothetical protein MR019_01875 [Ruminococcus sp.]|nr:hypothetical protein [Ruminococcus sp.]MDY3895477.1 hypothetical protein [Candidatus Fimenecus sp.]
MRTQITATADCDFTIENDLSKLKCNIGVGDKKHICLKAGDVLIFLL